MSEVKAMVLQWSGSWSTSMASRTLDTFADELGVYPIDAVKKALEKARRDWEQAKHPHLQFVLDRIESSEKAPPLQISGWEFTRRGVKWFGPAWNDVEKVRCPFEKNEKTIAYVCEYLRWEFDRSVVEFAELLGVEIPHKPAPRQEAMF